MTAKRQYANLHMPKYNMPFYSIAVLQLLPLLALRMIQNFCNIYIYLYLKNVEKSWAGGAYMLLWFCVSCTMGLFKTKNLSMLGALFVSGDASILRGQDQSVVASKLLHGKTHQIPIKLPITSQPKTTTVFLLLMDTLSVLENGTRT